MAIEYGYDSGSMAHKGYSAPWEFTGECAFDSEAGVDCRWEVGPEIARSSNAPDYVVGGLTSGDACSAGLASLEGITNPAVSAASAST